MQKLMTVSEIAKEAGVSVRTVQYYDNSGLLKPSAYTESGNRLYTSKELVSLYQIKSLKQLGLSLAEIKESMVSLDEPGKVLKILHQQKENVLENIKNLQNVAIAIDVLGDEIKNANTVDFAAYAKILSGTEGHMENMWSFKLMNQDLREHIISKFGGEAASFDAVAFYKQLMGLMDDIIQAQNDNLPKDSPKWEAFASSFDKLVGGFLDGNEDILPSLNSFEDSLADQDGEFAVKWKQVASFLHSRNYEYEGGEA